MRRRVLTALVVMCCAACGDGGGSDSQDPSGEYKTQPTEWFLRSIGPDDRTISIVYTMSGVASRCQQKGTTTVTEFRDKVVVTANKSVLTGTHACTQELAHIDSEVRLNTPLGSRALVGCRPGNTQVSENNRCRDTSRATESAPAYPSPAG